MLGIQQLHLHPPQKTVSFGFIPSRCLSVSLYLSPSKRLNKLLRDIFVGTSVVLRAVCVAACVLPRQRAQTETHDV